MTQNPNSGVLFKNDRKETDKHPDYTGKATVNGVELRLAAWIKSGAKGKFMSLSFTDPSGQREKAPEKYEPRKDDFDSEIPF